MMIRKILKNADKKLFGGQTAKLLLRYRRFYLKKSVTKNKFESIEIFYKKNNKKLLADLFDKYGSDKGSNFKSGHVFEWLPNSYADLYSVLFESTRNNIKTVFECGIGTNNPHLPSSMGVTGKPGASLRAWRDYFPNAEIYGADIDDTILFQEKRITTGFMNQLESTSIRRFFELNNLRELDLIFDDGLHTFDAAVTLFENAFPLLVKNGIYIIEDIHAYEMKKFLKYFEKSEIDVNFSIFTNEDRLPVGNLIWIRKDDTINTYA